MQDQDFVEIVRDSSSKSEICKKLGKPKNGTGLRYVSQKIKELNLDISHFSTPKDRGVKARKHLHTTTQCPVCNKDFDVVIGATRQKKTCSYACSNTLFRKGVRNGKYQHGGYATTDGIKGNDPTYRVICFKTHQKKCIVCGWDISVDVHHLDENHNNNAEDNLVPLCPNHHRMVHLKEHKEETVKLIKEILRDIPHE